jgi:hypothetical protein
LLVVLLSLSLSLSASLSSKDYRCEPLELFKSHSVTGGASGFGDRSNLKAQDKVVNVVKAKEEGLVQCPCRTQAGIFVI